MHQTSSISHAALHCSADALFLIDRATLRFLDTNSAASESLHYSPDELRSLGPLDLLPPESHPLLLQTLDRIIAGQLPTGLLQSTHRRKDASCFPVEILFRLVQLTPTPLLLASARDTTHRQQVEQALWDAENRFRRLATHAPVAIFQTDLNGHCVYVNDVWCRLAGLTPQQAAGAGWTAALHPDDRERINMKWHYAAAHALPFADEYRLLKPDGAVVWVYGVASPLSDSDGRVTGYIGTETDITARKSAEDALARENRAVELQRRRLRAILDVLPVGLFICDAEGKLQEANPAARAIWGATPVIGIHQWSQNPAWRPGTGQPLPHHERPLARALRENKPVYDEELEIQTFDGDRKTILAYAIPIHDLDGSLVGGVAAIIDITRRKTVEQELKLLNESLEQRVQQRTAEAERRAAQLRELASVLVLAEERERRALAADLHDDLGQLLTLARIKLSTLANSPNAPGGNIEDIAALVERANRLTRSLTFQLSPPILHELGLVPALDWLSEEVHRLYNLEVSIESRLTNESLDEKMRIILFRSIRELLINAAKHAKASRITVSLSSGTGRLVITVADNGRGFDVDGVMNRTRSAGFGLFSISERLSHMGGKMYVDSGPCRGTTIILAVPLQSPPQTPSETSP